MYSLHRLCFVFVSCLTTSDIILFHATDVKIDFEYVYKIFNGERNAKRDTLVAISFGMHLTFEETQLLLRIAKFAILDSRDRRDGIIIYALMHGLSIFECDDLLNNDNLITLV